MFVSVNINLFFDFFGLFCFGEICLEYVMFVFDMLFDVVSCVVEVVSVSDMLLMWVVVVEMVEWVMELFGCVWGIVGYLNVVVDMFELWVVYGENLLCVIEFWLSVGQNFVLYEKYKVIVVSVEYVMLLVECKKIFDNVLCDFCLLGVELLEDQKLCFVELQEQQVVLLKVFFDYVFDVINVYVYFVYDEVELVGLFGDVIEVVCEVV